MKRYSFLFLDSYSHVIAQTNPLQTVAVGLPAAVTGDVSKCFKLTAPWSRLRHSTAGFIWSFWQPGLEKVPILCMKSSKISSSSLGSKMQQVPDERFLFSTLLFTRKTLHLTFSPLVPSAQQNFDKARVHTHLCRCTHAHTHIYTPQTLIHGHEWERVRGEEELQSELPGWGRQVGEKEERSERVKETFRTSSTHRFQLSNRNLK